jgi:hypothetical protein
MAYRRWTFSFGGFSRRGKLNASHRHCNQWRSYRGARESRTIMSFVRVMNNAELLKIIDDV